MSRTSGNPILVKKREAERSFKERSPHSKKSKTLIEKKHVQGVELERANRMLKYAAKLSKSENNKVNDQFQIDSTNQNHPDHSVVLSRLRKIKGQLEGIEQMIHDRRYCVDILTQLKASSSALRSIEGVILKRHLRGCVQDALFMKDEKQIEFKIEEMVKLAVRS